MTRPEDVFFDIAGVRVPHTRVAARPMNFGQPIAGEVPLPYALALPVGGFRERMEPTYLQYLAELREDIDPGDPDEDDVSLGLLRAGWPPLDELLRAHPALAAEFLRRYMFAEVLDTYTGAPIVDYDYLLNSLDRVEQASGVIIFSGSCYASRRVSGAPGGPPHAPA